MIDFVKNHQRLLTLLAAMAFIIAIYYPGLTGDFIFDDFINIVQNDKAHLRSLESDDIAISFNSGIASSIGRPLAMLSFGLNYYFSELDPAVYKITNLLIHLATGVALYFLTLSLLAIPFAGKTPPRIKDHYIAMLVSLLWSVHPLQVSTTLYIVQRMTQGAAFFSVLALIIYLKYRSIVAPTPAKQLQGHILVLLTVFTGIGFKETAALTFLFILAIELSLYRFGTASKQQASFVYSFLGLYVLAPALLVLGYLGLHPDFLLDDYKYRDFTLPQRLLTETRIIWDYILWVLAPNSKQLLFYHDNYPISTSFINPLSTLFASLGIVALLASIFALAKRARWLSFGIAFFLFGHALESTAWPLELVFEHRNYLPSYGLLLGVLATLYTSKLDILNTRFVSGFSVLVIAVFSLITFDETRKWGVTPIHMLELQRLDPTSKRINNGVANMYMLLGMRLDRDDFLEQATVNFKIASEADTRSFNALLGLITAESRLGIETEQATIEEALYRINTDIIDAGEFVALYNINHCYFLNECSQAARFITRLYPAIGTNQTMAVETRQTILAELANDLAVSLQRPQDALAIYYYIDSLTDKFTINDIRIITIEGGLGHYAAALRHLEKTKLKAADNPDALKQLEPLNNQLQEFLP